MGGYAIIFNHIKFEINESDRDGTEHDVQALTDLFDKFDIYYEIYTDLTFFQITSEVEKLKTFDFTNYSYLAVIILSHGDVDNILCANNQPYNLTVNLVHPIVDNNPSLADKPKIFIIQACKGKNEHILFHKNADVRVCSPKITIPSKANICLAFSTYEGYKSERDPKIGGYFIQSLCKDINENGSTDTIEVIMRRVSKELNQNIHQVPMFLSTLTEEFFFCDKKVRDVKKEQNLNRPIIDLLTNNDEHEYENNDGNNFLHENILSDFKYDEEIIRLKQEIERKIIQNHLKDFMNILKILY